MISTKKIFILSFVFYVLFFVLTIINAQPYKCVPSTCGPTLDMVQDLSGGYVSDTRSILTGTGLSGGGDLSADRTIFIENTSVIPGSYTSSNITVDQQGRITSASSGVLIGDGTAAGQFLVWSTAWLPVSTSDLFFNSTSGRVGINQTGPERMLHITTDDNSTGQALFESDGTGSIGYAGALMRNNVNYRLNFFLGDSNHPSYPNQGAILITDGIDFTVANINDGGKRIIISPTNITLFGGVAATDYRLIFNGATSDGGFIWRQAEDRLETTASTTIINGLITDARAVVLADEAGYNLADATSGWGSCSIGDSQEWATFTWNSSGEVFIISSSANVSNTSIDGNLCIVDMGTYARIINRLGSSLTLKLEAKY